MGPVFAPLAHRGELCFPTRRRLFDPTAYRHADAHPLRLVGSRAKPELNQREQLISRMARHLWLAFALVAALVCAGVQAELNADMTQTEPGEVHRIADVEAFEARRLLNLSAP
jgi:hypothetical protein